MNSQLVIIGSGFAGTWAAVAAARATTLVEGQAPLEITVISPAPVLPVRPRFYEYPLEGMAPDVGVLFASLGVRHVAATVERIDADGRVVHVVDAQGVASTMAFDRCVLAAGSHLFRPPVPGLREHAFDIDQLESAERLAAHLHALGERPTSAARNTVVIVGGGFTGIEAACDMPARLRGLFGAEAGVRVVVVEQATDIGPDLGAGPRPVIETALRECGVEVVTGTRVTAIDPGGVVTASGVRIEAQTVVWTAGPRAHPLATQIGGEHDSLGRIVVDGHLRAPAAPVVFATGDVAAAATDDVGHVSLMSCQHAVSLGRVAGYNAAADLLGLPLHVYRQPKYVTCLDLGPWGAVLTDGWERQVVMQGAEAKALKRDINTKLIYPPTTRDDALAIGAPDFAII